MTPVARRTLTRVALAAAFLGACAEQEASPLAEPSTTVAAEPLDPEAACRRFFRDAEGGDPALGRPFEAGRFGLAVGATGCFVTHHGPDGVLLEVADVSFESPDGPTVVWTAADALPTELADRLMHTSPAVRPEVAGAPTDPAVGTEGGAPGTPGAPGVGSPDGSSPGPGAPTSDGSAPGGAPPGSTGSPGQPGGGGGQPAPPPVPGVPGVPAGNSTVPAQPPTTPPRASLDYAQLLALQASCIYRGEQGACATLEANGFPASTNHGLGTALSGASEASLVDDCSNAFELSCLELERRFPPAAGDDGVVKTFVDGVLSGSAETAASVASPGLLTHVPMLAQGPYVGAPGADIPGTVFGADGRLSFRIGGTTVVRCYVGSGSVRHCSVGAG